MKPKPDYETLLAVSQRVVDHADSFELVAALMALNELLGGRSDGKPIFLKTPNP